MKKSNVVKYGTLDNYLRSNTWIDTDRGCWLWMIGKKDNRYGPANWNGRIDAHRLSWSHFIGPVPLDKPFICHYCDVKKCINPAHLWAGTVQENNLDMDRKGRHRGNEYRGKRHLGIKS